MISTLWPRTLVVLLALLLAPWARADFELAPWPRGKAAPAIAVTDVDGQVWTSQRLKGRVVVLNFWATWCEPCRAEMPSLARLGASHPRGQLLVLALNYQESLPRVQRYLYNEVLDKDEGLTVALDADGSLARTFTRRIFPTTVVLGADGRPRYVITGQYDWASPHAHALLAPLLAELRR